VATKFKVGDHVRKKTVVIYGGDWLSCALGVVTQTKRKTCMVQFENASWPLRVHEDEIAPSKITNPEKLKVIEERARRAKEERKKA
jgi:hypothetical protein